MPTSVPRSLVPRAILLALALVVAAPLARPLAAHDLFLKLTSFFVTPGPQRLRIPVLNGTFTRSENSVARSRVRDVTLVGPGDTTHPATSLWSDAGDTSYLTIPVRRPGTYVLGASTRTRALRLTGTEFNAYLEEDGILDVLARRTERGELAKPARERYAKHVKALFQSGALVTDNFGAALGYPAEIVPLANPYALAAGDTLRVRCLVDGRPVAGQVVIAGGELRGREFTAQRARTDSAGVVRVALAEPGKWFVKFVHMVPVTDDPALDYESKWATLTFEVR